ncbi:MAG: NAD(P)-dependent oxidoreductase [Tenacibaculum sp.]
MKFGIIKERKNPPDKRVVFSPKKLLELKQHYPQVEILIESSDIRVFSDKEYRDAGFIVTDNISNCDILLGVKEVPINSLIPNKKYFFFSHTIKKQPNNRKLLQAILAKNIELYDYEAITQQSGERLIGFGRYAGLAGAYNGFRAFGLKENLFTLPKIDELTGLVSLKKELDKIVLPPIKILLTGSGKVANGVREIINCLGVKKVNNTLYLTAKFTEAVFCQIDAIQYNKRKDGKVGSEIDFFKHPDQYESNFMPFAQQTDFFIAGHFYAQGAPFLFTREDAKSSSFNIKYIADISCDINGPIGSTIRASTINCPFYGYDPQTESEVPYKSPNAITVMAVDNLPCELPKDASEEFGNMFLTQVIPSFYNNDKQGILERAKITEKGSLTKRYSYLQAYAQGRE